MRILLSFEILEFSSFVTYDAHQNDIVFPQIQ